MCYGNPNPQGTPGSVNNFANTTNYQGQYVGIPKTTIPVHDLMMQLDPDKFSIKNDNFNKLNFYKSVERYLKYIEQIYP